MPKVIGIEQGVGAVEAPEGVVERGKHSHGSCAEYEAVVSSI